MEKVRYSVSHGRWELEVDEFRGHLAGLILMECESPDVDALKSLVLPQWAADAVDVTANAAYKNKNLALYGLPR